MQVVDLYGFFPQFSLPLNRRRWLAADVVGDAVDAAHFVDDAAGDAFEEAVGEFGPVGGHEIAGLNGSEGHDVVVGAAIAHDAHAFDGEEDGEGLAGEFVPGLARVGLDGGLQLFDEDGVGAAE